jgi:RNA polymerase sigma-70 factor (ECF subfamily)
VKERFHGLLAANGPALLRLAASYAHTVSDRDDLFQEISLAIWRALPQFRGDSSERTFIFRIAHNRAMSHLAKRRRPAPPVDDVEVPDPRPDPESDLLLKQKHEQLAAAIRRLPVEYRQVVTLALEGLTYTEIADVVGIHENNVGVRLNRSRQMLRRLMEVKR